MQIKLFGIAKDIAKTASFELNDTNVDTVGQLKEQLIRLYPELASLKTMAVAVNHEYADDEQAINPNSEIALIPPVSGG